jgi:hypothetical protein
MKSPKLLKTTLQTLCYSWGSDTPPEAVWAANELLVWLENEYDFKLKDYFEESMENYDLVIEDLSTLIKA